VEEAQPEGYFQPGVSGNPKGRPKGARNKNHNRVSRLVERLASQNSKELRDVVDNVIKLAAAGEPDLMLAVLARVWPIPKAPDRTVVFDLPPIESAADAERAIGAVLAATAAGKLTISEGDKLAGTIGKLGEAVHMRLVEERLAALEAAGNAKHLTYMRVGP
jgi:hypothetical protein